MLFCMHARVVHVLPMLFGSQLFKLIPEVLMRQGFTSVLSCIFSCSRLLNKKFAIFNYSLLHFIVIPGVISITQKISLHKFVSHVHALIHLSFSPDCLDLVFTRLDSLPFATYRGRLSSGFSHLRRSADPWLIGQFLLSTFGPWALKNGMSNLQMGKIFASDT
jgi:hypothetical protein